MSAIFSPGVGTFTEDDEYLTTQTERENDVGAQYSATLVANAYILMVSLNNPNFPHRLQGQTGTRLDLTSLYLALDLAANSKGCVNYGHITRIDAINANIQYFFSVPFLTGAAAGSIVYALRGVPSQVKLDSINNIPQHYITNDIETNVGAVNVGTPLNGPLVGGVIPGLDDFIMKVVVTSGSVTMSQGCFYHSN